METNNDRIRCELEDMGLDIDVSRFPYTYHHDYIRRDGVSRTKVARRLKSVCRHFDEHDYSACYGAILYLISEQPEKITPELCGMLEYVRAGSVYNVDGVCDRFRMMDIVGV